MEMIIRIIIKAMIVKGENQTEMKGLWMWKEPCLQRVLEVVMCKQAQRTARNGFCNGEGTKRVES